MSSQQPSPHPAAPEPALGSLPADAPVPAPSQRHDDAPASSEPVRPSQSSPRTERAMIAEIPHSTPATTQTRPKSPWRAR